MKIDITPKKSEGLERSVQVTVPAESVRAAEDKAARGYASTVRLPGFRPGKAPAAIIRKKYRDAIRQEALQEILRETFAEVVERPQIRIASQPHVHGLTFTEGESITFEFHFELHPQIELARTNGFRVTRPAATVTEEQIDEQIQQLREQRATWVPEEDRPAPGDMVTVLIAIAEEGEELGEEAEHRLVLGAGQAIPGIEELIMELAPGSTLERPVRWPDDFPDESQRGKLKRAKATLQEVKRRALPPLDDAFAGEVGDFETMDALRTTIRADMEEHARREAQGALRQQLVDQVASANPFDVPQSWVDSFLDSYIKGYEVPESEQERFRAEFRPMAERQVRRDLIVESIAAGEKLEATESDIDERISEVAAKRGADPAQVYVSLEKAGRLKEIERSITEEKVFRWLEERNEIADAAG